MSVGANSAAEVVAAWKKVPQSSRCSCAELLHFDCTQDHEPLVVLDILDRIRDGYFEAVSASGHMERFSLQQLELQTPSQCSFGAAQISTKKTLKKLPRAIEIWK